MSIATKKPIFYFRISISVFHIPHLLQKLFSRTFLVTPNEVLLLFFDLYLTVLYFIRFYYVLYLIVFNKSSVLYVSLIPIFFFFL